ncbi:hypothetical protein G7Z17_g10297 [Cylindrodendrum hubeiense]|uniref:Histone-lysine N-methyltransferase, H3 lysine-9 specific dim-5 n=1 Tax=Cylindrodendrum hubeiense TaxID=595255 RepID=A0A9P5GXY7_9HYPO|nr:hypothetical protein G7Z17_g10297 [Cylindrodendrum hubeiense]
MEQATEQHFFHHGKGNLADEESNCHWCQIRSFPTHKSNPITVVNEVDSQILPKDFRFIDSNVFGHGVEPAEVSFRSGCACSHDGDCQYTGCLCLADLEDDHYDGDDDDGMDLDGPNSPKKAYAYHARGSKAGLLRSHFHTSKVPIYECHQGCACSINCPNRVVERGRTIPLQIFRTADRGWGIRSSASIKKGQFVDRYLGEIITSTEADRRRSASAICQRKDVYLFALDKFTDPDSLDPRLKGPPLEVDGEFMSGPTRFINHSCDPNMRIFARVGDHADKHIHDLALFAIKEIPKGEELTFDYVDGVAYEGDEAEGRVDHMTRELAKGHLLQNHVSQGRPDPRQSWCGKPCCMAEEFIFDNPLKYIADRERSTHGILVRDYYKDFVNAVVEKLFPEMSNPSAKARKRHAILSFVDSPPIKASLWKFIRNVKFHQLQISDNDLQAELIKTRPIFRALMFGDKSPQTIKTVHEYIFPGLRELRSTWKLGEYILEFIIRAEVWRRHKTCRSAGWSMGSGEHVAEFLTAVLFNYWLMYYEGCLATELLQSNQRWDLAWEDWMEKYPVGRGHDDDDGEDFVVREELDETEDVVLETVGYLGGIGKSDDKRKPVQRR